MRHPDTVRAWFRRYEEQGIAGLEYSAAVVRHTLCLSEVERSELIALRDKGSPAYVRERAGALLKIAAGCFSARSCEARFVESGVKRTQFARGYRAIKRRVLRGYTIDRVGVGSLRIVRSLPKKRSRRCIRRSRKVRNAFNVASNALDALKSGARDLVVVDGVSVPGIHYLLRRIGISYKRAREYMRSPDTDYVKKMERVEEVLEAARQTPETVVALYQDEFAFDRQPTVAKDWARTGTKTPLARQSFQSKQAIYGMGAMDAYTGRVVYHQVPSCTVLAHHQFYTAICAQYPAAERIYMIQDNRPLHFHPNLMAALLPQGRLFCETGSAKLEGQTL